MKNLLDPNDRAGLISTHLLESDATLSKPIAGNPGASEPGAGDWYVLIPAHEKIGNAVRFAIEKGVELNALFAR